MNKILDSDGMKITDQSWRSQFYGMIQEGHKTKVAPWLLKLIVLLLAAIAFTLELISGMKPTLRTSKYVTFGVPQTIDPDDKMNVPLYDRTKLNEGAGEASASGKKAKNRIDVVDRLRSIKLAGVDLSLAAMQVQAELAMGASNGIVIAKMTDSLVINGDEVFPSGTSLYGKGTSGEDRLYIGFTKAILPDRTSHKIKAQALDANDQFIGIKGKKISDVAFKIAASSGLIFLSGLADGMKQSQDIFHKPSMQDAALNGIATAASRHGEKVLQDMQSNDQKVEVKTKTSILVMFDDFDGKDQ